MPFPWNIHHDRWVIDDGEPEREVGESFEWFVVEFSSSDGLIPTGSRATSVTEAPDYSYNIVAVVVYVSESSAVIDFSLRAVGPRDVLANSTQPGEYVAGNIALFFPLCCHPLPDDILESMTRKWSVDAAFADLTPYRPGDESGRWLVRNAEHAVYEQIASTREKNANSYVLRCCLMDSDALTSSAE